MMHPATKTLRILLFGMCLFGMCLVALTAAAQAQTNIWTGPAVGDWDDPANWALGVVPQALSIPPDPLDVSVLLDTNASQDSSVLLEGTRSVGSLQIDAGDTLTIADDATLAVGPVLNSGSLFIVGHDQQSPLRGLRSVGTLVNAPGALLSLDNGIYAAASPVFDQFFWNQSTTNGYGTFRDLTIQNDGIIDANVGGDPLKRLTLAGSNSSSSNDTRTLRNTGALRASSGGTLRLFNWKTGGILNQSNSQAGTIEAQGDSTVLIENTTITGGRIATSTEGGVEEGQIQFAGQITLEGVELDAVASLKHISNTGLALSNSTFANKKTLSLDRDSLQIVGTNVLSGGGVFKLSGIATVRSFGGSSNQPTPKFVNVDNTVLVPQNSSATFGEEMFVENRGTFEANGPNAQLTLNMRPPDNALEQWTNTGTIRAVNGGKIIFLDYSNEQAFDNTGGILEFDGVSTLDLRRTSIRGGTLRGPTSPPTSPRFNGNIFGNATLDGVHLEGFVNLRNEVTMSGNIENTGTLKSSPDLVLASEGVTYTGGGELSLERVESSNNLNHSPPKFINVDNTLRLNDFFTYFDEVTFVNRGTVEASTPNIDSQLSVSFNSFPSPNLINSGVIRAIDGASLNIDYGFLIQNYEIDALDNVIQGKIQAGTGSEIRLRAVSGGILEADAGGVIRVEKLGSLSSQNSPTDLQLLGRIETDTISLAGTIRNDGQLVVSGDINNSGSSLSPSSPPVTLLGNGELQLDGTLKTRNSIFRNGPDHSIIGGGAIISEDSFFTNEGRIEANDSNTLTITHTGPAFLFQQWGELISSGNGNLHVEFEGQFTNRGTVRIAADARTTFDGNSPAGGAQFINANGAKTDINGSLLVRDSKLVNEEGGIVQGDGQVVLRSTSPENRQFFNHGTLSPGDAVGQLTIGGDFQQSTTGDLEIELGGTLPEEFDSLSAWSADLAGLLEVSLVDLGDGPFAPELGDNFEIISLLANGSVTGEFDTFLLPALATDLLWGIQYYPESVVLEILAPLQTDLDADGDVDGNDLLLVQRDDPSLMSQWQAEYGNRVIISSQAVSQAVPEPSTVWLVLVALPSFSAVRRR